MFDNKTVLITGGTGSLGHALATKLLTTGVKTIRIFSRDEFKQIQMQSGFVDERLRFLIGDVRDKERLSRALEGVDIVFHTAALKHVPIAEYNPFEAVKTNVYGAQNLIESCLDNNVELVLAAGTDKAVSPLNTYGATKFLMERLFVSANFYKGRKKTKFLTVRYGNVLGSRGSIVPLIVNKIISNETIKITDPKMTRFNITMPQALELIFRAIKYGIGGEIFIPKLKAYKLEDLKETIMELMDGKNETEIIYPRPGEKYHESLINIDEIRYTYETDEDYILFDQRLTSDIFSAIPTLRKSTLRNQYSSDKVELLTKKELKKILTEEKLIPQGKSI